MPPQSQQNNQQDSTYFDPNQDIDLSSIESEIIDTSRGDKIDSAVAFTKVYRFKCLNCGFMYEGKNFIEKCPRCGSDKLSDNDSTQIS